LFLSSCLPRWGLARRIWAGNLPSSTSPRRRAHSLNPWRPSFAPMPRSRLTIRQGWTGTSSLVAAPGSPSRSWTTASGPPRGTCCVGRFPHGACSRL